MNYVSGNYNGKIFQGKIIGSQPTPFNTRIHKIRLDFWIVIKDQIVETVFMTDSELKENAISWDLVR